MLWRLFLIAEAYGCRVQAVENVRQRLVLDGFELALNGAKRQTPPTAPIWDGEAEAKVIATRLGSPPAGYGRWTLQSLASHIVESISPETVRQVLKKRHDETQDRVLGLETEHCHRKPMRSSRRTLRESWKSTPNPTILDVRWSAWMSSRCS